MNYLTVFQLDTHKKKEVITYMSNSYKLEFGYNYYNSKQFNSKFREHKKAIEQLFDPGDDPGFFTEIKLLLVKKQGACTGCPGIQSYDREGRIRIDQLLPSYIHMMLNRLFLTSARLYELIIYDFLRRVYESQVARQKYQATIKNDQV